MRFFLTFLLAFFCQGGLWAQRLTAQPPNVIVFIADDVSSSDIGAYGNQFVQTPNIDRLAADGLLFNHAILTTSSCSPSRISILTGRYPHNTGAAELHTEPKVDFESMASRLKAQGYYTGQAGKWHMGELLKRGFDQLYVGGVNGPGGEDKWIPSLRERNKEKPFFFWFASTDAHRDWGPNQFSKTHDPEKIAVPPTLVDDEATRVDLAQYYDEIKRFDYYIGEVINELKKQGVYENTLIMVMADNGRPFPRDKTRLYDSGIRTPLIIHWPGGAAAGHEVNALVSVVDLAPTILDACGVQAPETFQGRSFQKLFTKPDREFRNYAFAEHNWHDFEAHERMVRTTDHLYIRNFRPELANQGPADAVRSPSFKSMQQARDAGTLSAAQADVFRRPRPEEELFALDDDPRQIQNILEQEPSRRTKKLHARLKAVLMHWMDETGDTVPEKLTKDWFNRESGERLGKGSQVRGEMPGEDKDADQVNQSGAF